MADILSGLSHLTSGESDDIIEEAFKLGIEKPAIASLRSKDIDVLVAGFRLCENLTSAPSDDVQVMFDSGILDVLVPLLTHDRNCIKKRALRTLSNLMAGNSSQVATILETEAILIIKSIIENEDTQIVVEAAHCIANLFFSAEGEQMKLLLEKYKLLEVMMELLATKNQEILIPVLEALENLLRTGKWIAEEQLSNKENPYIKYIEELDGLKALEELQKHESDEVYQKVYKIIETFFFKEDNLSLIHI
eukprot:TRINITY_DN5643_c0_g2_i3.p1 TRINITY_DN5643_c0_g2~~TRINITY_DN5643_c0_g2_i3.p1  ORF type:complete len:249 (-),score=35.44 TRINITY_DN5643_c0_g2_i3:62-808(-)